MALRAEVGGLEHIGRKLEANLQPGQVLINVVELGGGEDTNGFKAPEIGQFCGTDHFTLSLAVVYAQPLLLVLGKYRSMLLRLYSGKQLDHIGGGGVAAHILRYIVTDLRKFSWHRRWCLSMQRAEIRSAPDSSYIRRQPRSRS